MISVVKPSPLPWPNPPLFLCRTHLAIIWFYELAGFAVLCYNGSRLIEIRSTGYAQLLNLGWSFAVCEELLFASLGVKGSINLLALDT